MIDSKEIIIRQKLLVKHLVMTIVSVFGFIITAHLSHTYRNYMALPLCLFMYTFFLAWQVVKEQANEIHELRKDTPCCNSNYRDGNVYFVNFKRKLSRTN